MKIISSLQILVAGTFLLLGACVNPQNPGPQATVFLEKPNATLPSLHQAAGKLYLSWVDTSATAGMASLHLAELKDTLLVEQRTLAEGADWFINWADYPRITVGGDKILAHYLQNNSRSNRMAYDIKVGIQNISGPAEDFKLLNTDGKPAEHGFVSMLALNDSSFFITWLDGREMQQGQDHHHGHAHGAMTVRAAHLSKRGELSEECVIDSRACTCCQTTAALTDKGPVVLYRDCTIDNIRDIVISRKVGAQWTEPRPISLDGWKIEGCPVNGPKADASGNTLAVAWYTGAEGKAAVKVAFSADAGATFSQPLLLSKHVPLGRVDIKMLGVQQAIVSWMESLNGEDTFLYAQKVDMRGDISAPVLVDRVSSSRKSGFPQIEILDGRVYFAWVDPTEDHQSQLKIAYLPLSMF